MFDYKLPTKERYESEEEYEEALNAYFEAEAEYIEVYKEQHRDSGRL